MSGNKKIITREELSKEVLEKAGDDKDFKKALMDNPKETLERLGVRVPEEVEIRVVEESPQMLYLVLPVNPGELTDDQLGDVAGGFPWVQHAWRIFPLASREKINEEPVMENTPRRINKQPG